MSKRGTYQLLDCGHFQKWEQVGPYRIVRPAAQAVWAPKKDPKDWRADASFKRFAGGDGKWTKHNKALPESWEVDYGGMCLNLKLTDFGHLGLFGEQEEQWQKIRQVVRDIKVKEPEVRVLNLFAYTGGSTLAAAQGGAQVVHIDASKTSVAWARDNAASSNLADAPIRWIIDDVQKFVEREVRRGNTYHGIILDPPSFGRGAKNEVWNIEEHLTKLLEQLQQITAKTRAFVLLSAHSPGFSPLVLENLLRLQYSDRLPSFKSGEMVIPSEHLALPSGTFCLMQLGM